jgi:hypothetical protein
MREETVIAGVVVGGVRVLSPAPITVVARGIIPAEGAMLPACKVISSRVAPS